MKEEMVDPLCNKGKFMSKKEADKIKHAISICTMKLRTIIPYLGDNKPVLNENFNKLLIEKAILRDKLKNNEIPLFVKIAEKITRNKQRGLICDYFK